MSGNTAATRGATGRPLDILLWCVQAFLALVFVSSSWAELMAKPEMVALFTAVGFEQWLRYVTAILELTGAVLIRTSLHLARSTHYTGRPVSYVRVRRVGTAVSFPAP